MDFDIRFRIITLVGLFLGVFPSFFWMSDSNRKKLTISQLTIWRLIHGLNWLCTILVSGASWFFEYAVIFSDLERIEEMNAGDLVSNISESGGVMTSYASRFIFRLIFIVKSKCFLEISKMLQSSKLSDKACIPRNQKFFSYYILSGIFFAFNIISDVKGNYMYFSNDPNYEPEMMNFYSSNKYFIILFNVWHDVTSCVVANLSFFISLHFIHRLYCLVDSFCDELDTELESHMHYHVKKSTIQVLQGFYKGKAETIRLMQNKIGSTIGWFIVITIPSCITSTVMQLYKYSVNYQEDIYFNPVEGLVDGIISLARIFILMNCGSILHGQLAKWHRRLKKRIWFVDCDSNDKECFYFFDSVNCDRLKSSQLIDELVDWDWRFSAQGYFVVDRHLMSTIFASTVTYIIVLLQIKISSNPIPYTGSSGAGGGSSVPFAGKGYYWSGDGYNSSVSSHNFSGDGYNFSGGGAGGGAGAGGGDVSMSMVASSSGAGAGAPVGPVYYPPPITYRKPMSSYKG